MAVIVVVLVLAAAYVVWSALVLHQLGDRLLEQQERVDRLRRALQEICDDPDASLTIAELALIADNRSKEGQ